MKRGERLHHKAATYYLPRWQGGDVLRPLCHAGRLGYGQSLITNDRDKVNCPDCRVVMAGGVIVPRVARPAKRAYRPYVRVERKPPPARPVAPLVLPPPERRAPSMVEIARIVAERCRLSPAELMSPNRAHYVSHPRQRAMWAMRRAGKKTTQIARFFNCHHTTVIHGEREHEARRYGPAEQARAA